MRHPSRHATTALALATLALALTPPPARAEAGARPLALDDPRVGVLFPAGTGLNRVIGEETADPAMVQRVLTSLSSTLADLGYEVVPPEEIVMQLMQGDLDCKRGIQYCDGGLVRERLGLGAVVLAGIWTDGDPPELYVRVTVADAFGEARLKIDRDVEQVAPAALIEAMRDVANGRAIETRFDVLPRGARVTLDGERIGTAPVSARIAPGAHEVVAEHLGHVTTSKRFELPRGVMEPYVVRIELQAVERAGDGAHLRPRPRATATWDYVTGGTLAAVGVALLIAPVATLVGGADCRPGPSGSCEPVSFGSRSGLQLVGSAVTLAGGVYFLTATPIRGALSTDGESVNVRFHGTF